ncbi:MULTISPECIES: polysaccharide biosynthesis protein [unclassified Roseovarius]|uniref:polysaccharide biosynthesis protein n=1 Tax=unclassified Roseovarius TaxID=2614913 RepID=UPI00273D238C|nr:nucleoside-diphosphate sugar epimerase/dehydratase [Roseovarius sp. MMSF_3350]
MLYKLAISLSRHHKQTILLAIDGLLIALSHVVAGVLLLGMEAVGANLRMFLLSIAVVTLTGVALILFQGLHKIKLNAYQMQGVLESALVACAMIVTGILSSFVFLTMAFPVPLYVVMGMLFLILSISSRLALRQALLSVYRRGNARIPIIIYGAGQTGQQLATALTVDDAVAPVAFVDDDLRLQGITIAGLRTYSPADLEDLIQRYQVKRVVLAMPSANRAVQSSIIQRLANTSCEVHAMPSFADLVATSGSSLAETRPIDVNTLLGRAGFEDDLPGVFDTYRHRNILITGAGGSIGSELSRQLLSCQPAKLVLLDHCELALFETHRELSAILPEATLIAVLGSVTEENHMADVMRSHKIDIVLHAAAYKHVPLVEQNALEGIRNNVFGTRTVASVAMRHGVERFILVSTDKAVRPSSIMGASKRFAELAVQDLATRSSTTRFSMVRFGNVLGSSGSVIPLFQEQIARGGPVTLTHQDVTRYFMTIAEAVRLVLLTGSFARGGDVFVLDMGKPVPIHELARRMIENAGHTVRDAENPGGDIEIEVTGLRPGEKLHEELLIGSDMLTTPHPKILRAQEKHLSEIEMANALQSLRQAIETRNVEQMQATLQQWMEKSDMTVGGKSVNE